MLKKIMLSTVLSANLLGLSGCGEVTTDVIPVYDLTFWHDTSSLSSSVILSGTPLMATNFASAGGTMAKEQTFSNSEVNQQFPEYAEILLIASGAYYSLGFGCEECLRFRFKTNGSSNVTLNVVPDTTHFWINGDVFDRFDEIGSDEINIQYIDANDDYWPATSGTVTMVSKTVTPTSSETGEVAVTVTFNNVAIAINGNNYVLSGTAVVNATDDSVD